MEAAPEGRGSEPDRSDRGHQDDYGRTGEPEERAQPGKPYVKLSRLGVMLALFGGLALWRGLPILVIVAGIILMIFFHEMGHFVMARRAGMKVTEFMIGFGPRIVSFRRGEVEYGLKAIPAGAYVKIIGMANIEDVPPEDEAKTYRQKGYWARMGVAVAGSTMHFIMALVLIVISFVFVGRQSEERWAVATIAPGSAADLAGVRKGDRVASMDGVAVRTHDEMAAQAQKHPGDVIPVVVVRDGKRVELTADISSRFFVFGTNGGEFQVYENGSGGLSISLGDGNRLEGAGLRDGDTLQAIDGRRVTSAAEARELFSARSIRTSGNADLTVVHQNGRTAEVTIDVGSQLGLERSMGFFGVGKKLVPEKMSVVEAVPASHHRRDAVAVLVELIERLDGLEVDIAFDTVDHGVKVFPRNPVPRHGGLKCRPYLVRGGPSVERRHHVPPPPLERLTRFRARFVAQIVANAHEGVHRAHGVVLRFRKQRERVIEILGAILGELAAPVVGELDWLAYAARKTHRVTPRSKMPTRSTFEIAGRAFNTSKFCASILSRIASPPRLNNSRSSAKRRFTIPMSGRPS